MDRTSKELRFAREIGVESGGREKVSPTFRLFTGSFLRGIGEHTAVPGINRSRRVFARRRRASDFKVTPTLKRGRRLRCFQRRRLLTPGHRLADRFRDEVSPLTARTDARLSAPTHRRILHSPPSEQHSSSLRNRGRIFSGRLEDRVESKTCQDRVYLPTAHTGLVSCIARPSDRPSRRVATLVENMIRLRRRSDKKATIQRAYLFAQSKCFRFCRRARFPLAPRLSHRVPLT